MSQESFVTVPPDSDGKRLRALNYTLSGQNAAQSVWSEVINIGDPQSGAYLALVNASGALSVSTSGDAVSVSGNIVGVYAASQQSGWMAVVSGVQATSGALTVSSSGLATVAISSGGVIPVMAASFQSGWAAVVSGVGATSGQLNVASSGIGAVAIASGGIIPISIISGNVVALSGIVEIVSGQTVTVVSSGVGTIAVSSGGVIPTMLASAQSGGLVGISGGGLTISGGVTISGLVGISGGGLTISGGVTISGLVGISGGGLTISGGVTVSGSVMVSGVGNTSGQLNIASSGLGTVAVSSGGILPIVGGLQSGQLVIISGITVQPNFPATDGYGTSGALAVGSFGLLFNGGTWERLRSVAGSSGSSQGVTAVQFPGYSYKNFTGAVITNVKNGACYLHSVIINSYSSGLSFQIFDSQSGATGNSLGVVNPDAGSLTNAALAPTALIYDCLMTSGIAVTSSGANWDVTVLWRAA